MIRVLILVSILAASRAGAQDLVLPDGASRISHRSLPLAGYDLPTGPWADGTIPVTTFEGQVDKFTWRLPTGESTTLATLRPLRGQLQAAGFDIVLDCEARACGGFDFRFGTDVVPSPDMYVSIRDYRFLSAVRAPDRAVSILVSRNGPETYVQMIRVTPVDAPPPVVAPPPADETGTGDDYVALLIRQGFVILGDLQFRTGSDALGDGPFASLRDLAELLQSDPETSIALVGHTDNIGALASNIALSKRRAQAVRQRLTAAYGIDAARIEAEGVGYLAPLRSNATPQGREANRRVVAVLLQGG